MAKTHGYATTALIWAAVWAGVLLGAADPAAAQADAVPRGDTWAANGPLWAMKALGNVMYIGGNFSYVGPETGNLAAIDGTIVGESPDYLTENGDGSYTFPNVLGAVYACIPDGDGANHGWYIGGDFEHVDGVPRDRIARLIFDPGQNKLVVDPVFNPTANDTVYTLALSDSGNTLFAGGRFLTIGGAYRPYLAALNTNSGDPEYGMARAWNPYPNEFVRTMALSENGTVLYVGGQFTSIEAERMPVEGEPEDRTSYAREHIAAFNVDTANATDYGKLALWNPGASGMVETMCLVKTSAEELAGQAIRTIDGTEVTVEVFPPADNEIWFLEEYLPEGLEVVAGSIEGPNGYWIPSQGKLTFGDNGADPVILKYTVEGPDGVYTLGGSYSFDSNVGATTGDRRVVIGDAEGEGEGEGEGEPGEPGEPYTLYLGGWFGSLGGADRSFIGALDAASGAVQNWSPFANSPVFTLAADEATVYPGGTFTFMGYRNRTNIAALDRGDAWAHETWNPGLAMDDWVTALAVPDVETPERLYVGGRFARLTNEAGNPVPRPRLAALRLYEEDIAPDGELFDWNPGAGGAPFVLGAEPDAVLGGNRVWAGGELTLVNGDVRHCLAALDMIATSAEYGRAREDWAPRADNAVYALEVSVTDRIVYAGGVFENIIYRDFDTGTSVTVPRNHLAAIHANLGAPEEYGDAVTGWTANMDGVVHALALAQPTQTLYVGGRNLLTAVNAADPSVELGWAPDWDRDPTDESDDAYTVYALAGSNDGTRVYAGGSLNEFTGVDEDNLGQIQGFESGNNTALWTLPANYPVLSLALANSMLYAGGQFTRLGSTTLGQDCGRIAALNLVVSPADTANAIDLMDTAWQPAFNGDVSALMISGTTLYAGGNFGEVTDSISTNSRERLAAIGISASNYGNVLAWGAVLNNPIYALANAGDGTFFAGGAFSGTRDNLGGTLSRSRIAHFALADPPPVITLLGDNPMTLECGELYAEPGATASDIPDGVLDPALIFIDIYDEFGVVIPAVDTSTTGYFAIVYTLDYVDVSGQTALPVTRWVYVVDDTPPVITALGDNPLQVECGTGFNDPGAIAVDNCDGDLTLEIAVDSTVNPNVVGDYVVVYSVTDGAGNPAVPVTRTVNVVDTIPPVITLIGADPLTLDCDINGVFTDPGATVSDSCDPTPSLNSTNNVNLRVVGIYTVNYTARDADDNTTSRTRTVEVVDNTPPAIALTGDALVTVQCSENYTDAGATAFDGCDGDRTAFITVSGAVDTAVVGTYTLTYTVSDSHGNPAVPMTRTVEVVDTLPPVIELNSVDPFVLECNTIPFTDLVDAFDDCEGDLTAAIITAGSVNTAVVDTYTLTYTVSDTATPPNTATRTRTVVVDDTIAPVITLTGTDVVNVECGDPYTDAGATAADSCDGDLTASIATVNPVNTLLTGVYTVTYNVSDGNGNAAAEVTRTVNVADTIPPVLTLNGALAVTVECRDPYTDAGATADDDCDGDLTGSVTATVHNEFGIEVPEVDVITPGDYTITYTVSDGAGNAAVPLTRTVEVVDTGAPRIFPIDFDDAGAPEVVECRDNFTPLSVQALDDCEGDITSAVVVVNPVDTTTPDDYEVTYDVTDSAGNAAAQVICRVRVEDTEPPVITLPPAIIECGELIPDPSALDYCAGIVDVIVEAGNMYTATDPSGNSTSVEHTVTGVDTQPPVITVLGDNPDTLECDYSGTAVYDDPGATADDACEGPLPVTSSGFVNSQIPGTYTILYTATDTSGNEGTATRTVEVVDTTPPLMNMGLMQPALPDRFHLHDCGAPIVEPWTFSVFDSCEDALIPLTVQVILPASGYAVAARAWRLEFDGTTYRPVYIGLTPDIRPYDTFVNDPGDYLLFYVARDSSGNSFPILDGDGLPPIFDELSGEPNFMNPFPGVGLTPTVVKFARLVRVVDTALPEIDLVDPIMVNLECGIPYVDPVSAWDQCDGDLTSAIVTTEIGNTHEVGSYTIEYTVTDTAGNAAVPKIRSIIIADTTAPAITVLRDNPVTVSVGSAYVDAGATALDLCEGDLTPSIVTTITDFGGNVIPQVDTNISGTYYVVYTVSDTALPPNSATATREVNVAAKSLPVSGGVAKALQGAFAFYDVNGDGVLAGVELDRAYAVLARDFPELTPEQYALFVKVWSGGGDKLTREQIDQAVAGYEGSCSPDATGPLVLFTDVTLTLGDGDTAALFDGTAPFGTPAIIYLYDNCAGAGEDNLAAFTLTAEPDIFDCAARSGVAAVVTVTDASGNSTSGTITVTVTDADGSCPEAEGEAPVEGEAVEGEGEDDTDEGGCCRCDDTETPAKALRRHLGDWLLLGLTLAAVIMLGTMERK